MTLMGYTEQDIEKMMLAIWHAKHYMPPNKNGSDLMFDLDQAYMFLEGMIEEGRV
jgi:hypothetical protein